ncbi:MAG TPA: glycosyltransferase family 39 protein [Methylomirabilota bacterium]|nr:glycosyltransferase family 39 protein [Methylomirabilota bacterium]
MREDGARSERTVWLLLGGLLVVGALARIWGNDYGLPHTYHPDEGHIVNRAIRFHGGDLDPKFFNWPSLYMYVLSAVYGVVFGLRGVVAAFSQDPIPFYLIGRTLTALMGTATIAVLYVLAAEAYGVTVGLLAGLFLTVNLLHIRDSHYITTDVPLTFLITVALLFVFRYWREGRRRDALWSGLFAGLAASMKYPGGLVLLPLVLAHGLRPGTAGGVRAWLPSPGLVLAGGFALVGFLVGTPYAVLTPVAFVGGVLSELREVHTVQFGNEADMSAYLFHLLHSFPEGMGVPLFLLGLGGVGLALLRHGRREVILLAFPLPYFLVIGSWSSRFERYTLPLLPFLALLAALCLVALATWIRDRGLRLLARPGAIVRPGLGLTVAATLLVAPELARIAEWQLLLGRPDTRVLAGEWIEREIPNGARIAMEPYSPAIRLSPAMVRAERQRLGDTVAAQIARHRFDQFLARSAGQAEQGYWLFRLNAYDLGWLAERRVEYVVLSGFTYQRYQRACDRYPEACRFYAELERRATLVYAIESGTSGQALWVGDIYSPLTRLSERARPGPPIKIYRLPTAN